MVWGTFEEFSYGLCPECGVLWLITPPADISKYYAHYYSLQAPGTTTQQQVAPVMKRAIRMLRSRQFHRFTNAIINRLHRFFLRKGRYAFNAIMQNDLSSFESSYDTGYSLNLCAMFGLGLRPNSRILDFGSGTGQFVLEMSQLGFSNIIGLDPFIESDIVFPTGARVYKGSLSSIHDSIGTFDVITLHHTFEHIPNPFEVAEKIAHLLNQKGVLVLRFPNIGSPHFKRYRENWWGIHAPRHYFLYSRKSLEIVFEQVGIKIYHVKCDSEYDHYLYSQEYELGIPDNSRYSIRSGSQGSFTHDEINYWKQKARLLNRALVGDWIVYYLRHK